MAVNGGGISISLTLDDQLSGGLMRANAQVDSFGNSMSRLIRGVEAARGSIAILRGDIEGATVALAAFGAGAAVAGAVGAAFVNAAQQAAEYQKQVQLIQNNTVMTDEATKQMSASIMQMSSQTGSALNDLGQGFMRISNFGNDAADATTILSEANKAAVESGSKVVDVANAGAAVMHEYGAATSQAGIYFNTLAEAAKLGNSTMQEFVDGSSRSIAVAANLGVSFTDVSSAMVAMTRHGFDLSTANTQVASIMQHIVDPSTAARAEIEKLSNATGVDLVYDFSLAGLQAKGLVGVMDDLRTAVGNNKDEIFKLIPALRGGQGALVLSGVGNQDLHQAEGDLQNTMDGMQQPVEDGFKRMQETASYQFSVLRANVVKDSITIGQSLMNLAGPIANLVNAAPSGVVTGGFGVVAAAAGAHFASSGLDKLGNIGVPTDQQKAIYNQQLADYQEYQAKLHTFEMDEVDRRQAYDAQIESIEEQHQARMKAILQEGIAAQQEINAEALANGGIGSPAYAASIAQQKAAMQAQATAVSEESNVAAQAAYADLRNQAIRAPAAVAAPEALGGAGALGALASGLASVVVPVTLTLAVVDVVTTAITDAIAEHEREIRNQHAEMNIQTAIRYSVDPASRDQGRRDLQNIIDEDQKSIQALNDKSNVWNYKVPVLGGIQTLLDNMSGNGPKQWAQQISDFQSQISEAQKGITDTSPQHFQDQAMSEFDKHIQDLTTDVQNNILTVAQATKFLNDYGDQAKSTGATDIQVTNDKKNAMKVWDEYTKSVKAAADAQAELLATQRDEATKDLALGVPVGTVSRAVLGKNADGTDATKEQQAAAKRDITDISKAWTDAATAVGKIDMTKGVSGLASAADDLGKATDMLSKFGLGNEQLSDVTGLADAFKSLTDMEKQATAQLDGYMLNLNQTAGFLKQIQDLQNGFNSAVDDAQTRALAGTANGADIALIGQRTSVNATLTQQRNTLGQRQSSDWLNITSVMPNWERLDQISRDAVASFGGGQVLMARVDADVTAAQNAIDTMINHPYKLNVQADLSRLFVGSGINAGAPVPAGATSGGTMTANGDATILQKYSSSIKNYAGQTGIDPALIGAIIMEESGGQAGVSNMQGSGATGLMQVMPGQGYDTSRMTGTDAASADYQIYAGVDLLQKKLVAAGGDMQAALTSYGFGVGSNHSIDQLKEGYLTQSRNALTGSGGNVDDQGITDAVGNGLRSKIVSAAVSQQGQDKMVGWCEQWVEDTVQSVLGNRGPASAANQAGSASKALNFFQNNGMVRPPNQAPQPGDLVYYAATPGDPDGHVAIYVGGGNQASTWDKGPQTGTNRQIHIEPVGNGAQYVALPGTGSMPDNGGPGVTNNSYPSTGTINGQNQRPAYNQPSLSQLQSWVSSASTNANNIMPKLDNQGALDVQKSFQAMQPDLENYYAIMSGIPTELQNANDKFTFQMEALATGKQIEADQAQYLYDIENHTGNISADIAKMNQDAGDMAGNVKQQADDFAAIAALTATVKKDQQDMTDLNNTHQQQLDQQKIQDESLARGKQEQQWTQQLTDQSQKLAQQSTRDQWQLQSDQLDDQKTAQQRNYQDAVSNADRQHVLAQRASDDNLKALERLQVTQQSSDSEQERVLKASALGPGNIQQKFQAGEQLSIQIDYDQRQKQSMIDQINNAKTLQTVEQRNYEDTKYNLDQANVQATRNFEDQATQMQRNQQATEQGWQKIADDEWTINFNREKSDTEAAWQLQDQRDQKNQIYQLDKASLDLKTKNDQKNLDDAKLIQQYNDNIATDAEKALPLVQHMMDIIINGATGVVNGKGSVSVNGTTISPGDVSSHASGGMITTPYAVVGENGPELISAMGYYVSPTRGTSSQSGSVNVNINVAGGNSGFTDADVAEIEAVVQKIMARKGATTNPSGKARGRY